ncbi:hypothetical protein [Pseudooceanicola sp.]|uniref:hypothetical protein n=1 Tax=Pseudooceanicola sp. TaxID=1914328 RepID=UPI00262DAAE7|nr:hypothetical protein [Pseudooceanicola sp.]
MVLLGGDAVRAGRSDAAGGSGVRPPDVIDVIVGRADLRGPVIELVADVDPLGKRRYEPSYRA